MYSSPVKIITYPGSRYAIEHDRDPLHDIEEIPEAEWLVLITFRDGDIPKMAKDEITRRLAALRSIDDAPHFCFNWEEKGTLGFKIFFEHVMKYGLNGNADGKIYELEKYVGTI